MTASEWDRCTRAGLASAPHESPSPCPARLGLPARIPVPPEFRPWTPGHDPSAILSIGRVAMLVIWEGHLAGEFRNYRGGRVYDLADGSRWCQQDNTDEPVYREQPRARLLEEGAI